MTINSSYCKPIHDDIYPPSISRKFRRGMSMNHNVRYLHIKEEENTYSIGVFVFPPGAKIPLHDHPGMCVVSKCLYGELHAKSFDFIEEYKEDNHMKHFDIIQEYKKNNNINSSPSPPIAKDGPSKSEKQSLLKRGSSWLSNMLRFESFSSTSTAETDITDHRKIIPDGSKLCKQHKPTVILASDVKMLFPHIGNIHEFTAGEQGAAMLDILLPPYEYEEDRDCVFYREEPFHSYNVGSSAVADGDDENRHCWLLPIPQPSNFQCTSGSYLNYGESNEQ